VRKLDHGFGECGPVIFRVTVATAIATAEHAPEYGAVRICAFTKCVASECNFLTIDGDWCWRDDVGRFSVEAFVGGDDGVEKGRVQTASLAAEQVRHSPCFGQPCVCVASAAACRYDEVWRGLREIFRFMEEVE
jgi:hypothetical protein